MYYVYILLDKQGKHYIGYSHNLRQRIKEHRQQKVYTTRRIDKPDLFYYEAYSSEQAAKKREKKLKSYGSAYKGLLIRLQN